MIEFLEKYIEQAPISFHMPGHKGAALYHRLGYGGFFEKAADLDITELPGADNLFQAEGILDTLQQRYAALYEVRRSHLLVNGSSGGILASILAAVPRGGKLILARNAHKSVFNALSLGDIRPVYAYPKLLPELEVAGEIEPEEIERLLKAHPDASAVVLPSPNYYGICSDIARIAELVHAAGLPLIVDQAHGAHLKIFRKYGLTSFPGSAEEQGADVVVNSTHKTLASFTQSAVLNICTDRVDQVRLEDKLQAVQSSSPSYILMASLEINLRILERYGAELMAQWQAGLDDFYGRVREIQGVKCLRPSALFDHTKLNLSLEAFGLSGAEVSQRLCRAHHIYPELHTGGLILFMSGIGNTREDYAALLAALQNITAEQPHAAAGKPEARGMGGMPGAGVRTEGLACELFPIPNQTERVSLAAAAGRICASGVIPYPPGIPLICPGEKFTEEIVRHVSELRASGEKVIGVGKDGCVSVGR